MARAVLFHETGGPEVLRLENVQIGDPGRGEVRIRIDAIGLNRAEALFRSGAYWLSPDLPSSRLGHEAAGVVEAAGEDVHHLKPGDPISTVTIGDMSAHGVYGDRVIVPASEVIERPAGIDAVTGAATWLAYTTAYGALVEVGRLRPGATVLITAAAGAVGIAAIRIAKHLGAIPIATTRDETKHAQLAELGAAHVVPADHVLKEVQTLTGGRGAALVLDAIAGPGLETLAQVVAPDGTLIVTSNLDPSPTPLPWTWPLDLRKYANPMFYGADPARMERARRFITAGLDTGAFAPVIDRTFDLTEIVEAHRHLDSNAHVGKVVVEVRH
ncbi:zinc-dependent alcohol dehydrogenase family protein [Actinomadura rudentiformis]|uniref:Zinc-dependent alcohol dehydrogenase family protein n=2 Tax=Actinomadura rudentiformis TaxID=359158 RepID=A0A6H9YQ08_9ACTN|nr:zinc-dependent alcohol dehydrogenase family protein [Actinomadura rudentiformis]